MVSEALPIQNLARFVAYTIQRVSGLDDLNALVAAYYCLATWFVPRLELFPILNVSGPNGTGKSQLLRLCGRTAYHAHQFTGTRISFAALRDELAKANGGLPSLKKLMTARQWSPF